VTDPRKFKAPYNPKERVWQEADRLRAACPAGRSLPVQVLDFAEFDLGLELIPTDGLREQLDIDALLMGDLNSILVDKRGFMNPRLEYRLRFSVAHEIGHLILHRDIYGGLKHASAREWFDYISAIPEVEYGWVEWQAYEFAGRLLVPPEPLREAFQAAIQSAQAAGYSDWLAADEAALDYIATRIAPKFGVSVEVIAKRLRVEKLWPPPV
jgi:IrrE N-terminal-like domain